MSMKRDQRGGAGLFLLLALGLAGLGLVAYLLHASGGGPDLGGLELPGPTPPRGEKGPDRPAPREQAAPPTLDRREEEGALADQGTIMGRLLVEAGEGAPRVGEYTIWLEEARNPTRGPKKHYPYTFQYFSGEGRTGTFRISPIPHFGAWRVVAMVPGMNADEVIRVVDARNPVARVTLKVERGRTLTVNVQDPERNPYTGVDVTLHPKGRIPGRRILAAKTDDLGNAVFTNVVKGAWRVQVNQKFRRLAEPREIEVTTQGPRLLRIRIPRGGKLAITVLSPGGAPLPGIKVQAYDLHARRWQDYSQETDKLGVADFGKVPPGRYIVRILNVEGYQSHHEPGLVVKKDEVTEKTIYLKFRN